MSNLGVDSPSTNRRVATPRHASLVGAKRYNSDGTPFWVCKLYNGTGGALTANRPYLVHFEGASSTTANPQVTALAAQAGVPNQVVIALTAVANGAWGEFCYQGYHDCGVEGTTDVAADDFLKVDAGVSTSGLVKDGTSRTQRTFAIALAAQAANSVVDTRVFLLGCEALTSDAETGSTQVLTSSAAGDIPLTITAHASQTANLLVVENSSGTDQNVVDASFRLGLGKVSSLSYRAEILGTGDNTTSGAMRIANSSATADAGAIVQFESADSDGKIGAFPDAHTGISSLFAGRLVMQAGTTSAGLMLAALSAGHDIVIRVPTLGNIATFAATGITLADATNFVLNATTGTKIGTATTQKLAFFNSTPVVQPGSTADIKDSLVALGLIATGGATPLDLDSGAFSCGAATIGADSSLADGVDIAVGTSTGTKIGTATSQKLGFFNATPIVQASAYTQTFATADKTHAARTAIALTVTDGVGTNDGTIGAITADASVIAAVQELAAAINALRVDHLDTASIVNSVIDDIQAFGFAA